jgi:hypothetical protein
LGFTEAPYRRNTGSDLEDAGGSSLYKSTRHLLPLEHYEGGAVWARGGRPTPATIQVRAMLGDACGRDLDCGVTHSRCLKGGCVCKDAYVEAPDKQECLCEYKILKHFDMYICMMLFKRQRLPDVISINTNCNYKKTCAFKYSIFY